MNEANNIDSPYIYINRGHHIDSSPFTVTANTQSLRFDYRNSSTDRFDAARRLRVYVLSGPEFATITHLANIRAPSVNQWRGAAIDLQAYQGQTIKVRFQAYSSNSSQNITSRIDNVYFEPAPTTSYTIVQDNLPAYTSSTSDTINVDVYGGTGFYANFGDFIVDTYNSTIDVAPTTIATDGDSTAVVTVTLRDNQNNPLSGYAVEIIAPGQNITVTQPLSLTNASGEAVGEISSTIAPQTIQVSARSVADNTMVAQTVPLSFTTGLVDSIHSSFVVDPSNVIANGTDTSAFTIVLRDQYDNLVSGHPVTITHDGNAVDITLDNTETDVNGQLTGSVISTIVQTVTLEAIDAVDGVLLNNTPVIFFTSVDPDLSSLHASPISVVADGMSTSIITVTLRDKNNNPLPNKPAHLQISGADTYLNGQLITETTAIGQSGADGVITASLASTAVGIQTIQAYGDEILLNTQSSVTFTVGVVSHTASLIESSVYTIFADGNDEALITATLYDDFNHPVPNQTALIQAAGTGITLTQPVTESDAQGVVTATIRSADVQTVTITAVNPTNNLTLTQPITLTFTPAPAVEANSTIVITPTTLFADGVQTTTITATLHDLLNRPLVNRPINLIASGSANIISPTATAMTDADGNVLFYLSSTQAETKQISLHDVTANTPLFAESVTFDPSIVDPAHSSIIVLGKSVAAPDGLDSIEISVIARDAFNNNIPNATVILTSTTLVTFNQPAVTDQTGQTTGQVTSSVADTAVIQAVINGILISDTVDVTFADADLSINKSGQTTVAAGGTVVYDIVVTNQGGQAAADIIITDTLPASTTFIDSSLDYITYDETTKVVVWAIDFLDAGDSAMFTVQAQADVNAPSQITNTIEATFSESDPTPADNQDSHTTSVSPPPPGADLFIHKSGPAQTPLGLPIAYHILIANQGGQQASGIVVTDTLPAGVTYISSTHPEWNTAVDEGTGQVVWQIGSLAVNESYEIILQAQVQPSATLGIADNAVTGTASEDADLNNNTSHVYTTLTAPVPQLTLTPATNGANPTPLWIPSGTGAHSMVISATNSGTDALLGGLTVTGLDYTEWLTITPAIFTDSIGIGETVTFTITATPSATTALYYDRLFIESPDDDRVSAKPFYLEIYVHPELVDVPVHIVNNVADDVSGAQLSFIKQDARPVFVDGIISPNHPYATFAQYPTTGSGGTATLTQMETGIYNYTVSAARHETKSGIFSISTNASFSTTLTALPGLVFEPEQEATLSLIAGESNYLTFQVRNTGPAVAANFAITTPADLPWVSSGLPYSITELAVGEAMSITLFLEPPLSASGHYYDAVITVTADLVDPALLIAHMDVLTAAMGSLDITVADGGSFAVADALVVVTNRNGRKISGANGTRTVYDSESQTTDFSGSVHFPSLPPAEYTYSVEAEGYYLETDTVQVQPGTGSPDQTAVQLNPNPFSYNWTVEETTIVDTYAVTIEITYEEDVLKPLLYVNPASFCPGENVNFIVANVGPITMTDIVLTPDHVGVVFSSTVVTIGELAPGTAYTGTFNTSGDDVNSAGRFNVAAEYYTQGESFAYATSSKTTKLCPTSGGSGGGNNGGGGGGGGGNDWVWTWNST